MVLAPSSRSALPEKLPKSSSRCSGEKASLPLGGMRRNVLARLSILICHLSPPGETFDISGPGPFHLLPTTVISSRKESGASQYMVVVVSVVDRGPPGFAESEFLPVAVYLYDFAFRTASAILSMAEAGTFPPQNSSSPSIAASPTIAPADNCQRRSTTMLLVSQNVGDAKPAARRNGFRPCRGSHAVQNGRPQRLGIAGPGRNGRVARLADPLAQRVFVIRSILHRTVP